MADTVQNQPDARAFSSLFPAAEHFITHYTGTTGPRVWNSRVLIHERYFLTMQFDMTLDTSGVKVTATAPPKYYLSEVTKVTVMPSGQIMIDSDGKSAMFGPTEWKKLEAAAGDISVLGIQVKRDQPVKDLKDHWRGA